MEKSLWLYFGLFFIIAIVALFLIPFTESLIFPGFERPGPITLLGIGIIFTGLTVIVLSMYYKGMKMTKGFLISAIAYNALIVITKFVLSPLSLYQANKKMTFDCSFFENPLGLIMISGSVFLLYFAVFFIIHLYYKHKVKKAIGEPKSEKNKSHKVLKIIGTVFLVGLVILTAGIPFLLLFFVSSYVYLFYLSASGIGVFISLSLIAAILFLRHAYSETAKQAIKIRDAGLISIFFWIGASLIFIYSALWVVYILILIGIWPLRTVCPK